MYPVMNSLCRYELVLISAMKEIQVLNDLRKDIQSDLETGHALNETDWNEPDNGNDDGYEVSPPMHVGRIS